VCVAEREEKNKKGIFVGIFILKMTENIFLK